MAAFTKFRDRLLKIVRTNYGNQSREWVDGSWVKWVKKIGWVTYMSYGSLGVDPSVYISRLCYDVSVRLSVRL